MTISPGDRLRSFLNESIAPEGSDSDTRFTDEQIQDMLDQCFNNVDRAAVLGWTMKAAIYADLITVSEGNALRQMSDLHKHALDMIKQFSGTGNMVQGRTRVGRIRRRGSWGW